MTRKTWRDPKGITRTWESAERRTRPKTSDIDGVGIVAILEKETGDSSLRRDALLPNILLIMQTGTEIVLQKQYRPPLDKIVIELPAGLVDEGETAEQCAVRELREETGYVGQVLESSPVMWNGKPTPFVNHVSRSNC